MAEGGFMELMLDGYVKETLDRGQAHTAVLELARRIDMTPVGEFQWTECDLGPSFVQIIEESHIIGHYWNQDSRPPYLGMEIFSCKPFKPITAQNTIVELFGIWEVRFRNLSDRGFPL